jgi:hypothetical protein
MRYYFRGARGLPAGSHSLAAETAISAERGRDRIEAFARVSNWPARLCDGEFAGP